MYINIEQECINKSEVYFLSSIINYNCSVDGCIINLKPEACFLKHASGLMNFF